MYGYTYCMGKQYGSQCRTSKEKQEVQLDQYFSSFNMGGRFIALIVSFLFFFLHLGLCILWQYPSILTLCSNIGFFPQNDSIKIDTNKRHLNVSSLFVFFHIYHQISISVFQRIKHHVKQGSLLDFWFVRLHCTTRQHLSSKKTGGKHFVDNKYKIQLNHVKFEILIVH